MTTQNMNDRLGELRKWREDMTSALSEKISSLRHEKSETMAAYDEEIGQLESELRSLGVAVESSRPNEIGVRAYNFLLEHAPDSFHSGEIMQAIHSVGAVASIVLRPFVDDGKVITTGSGRSIRYSAVADSSDRS